MLENIAAKAEANKIENIIPKTTPMSAKINMARQRFFLLMLVSAEKAQTSIIIKPTTGMQKTIYVRI